LNFSKLFETLKGPLLSVASTFIPGGPAILGAINAILPDDKKLPDSATGGDIRLAVQQLPPAQRASLMEKQLDVQIAEISAWEGIQASLAQADEAGSSTRPFIALMMAWVVVVVVIIFVLVWAVAIATEDSNTLSALANSWQLMLAIIATPTVLLRSYFGMRTKEKMARYSAATEQPFGSIANLIGALKK